MRREGNKGKIEENEEKEKCPVYAFILITYSITGTLGGEET